jgi:HK97 family phage major capsid protein
MNLYAIQQKLLAGETLSDEEKAFLEKHLAEEQERAIDERISKGVAAYLEKTPARSLPTGEPAAKTQTKGSYSQTLRAVHKGMPLDQMQAAGLGMSKEDIERRGLNSLTDEDGGVLISTADVAEIQRYVGEYGAARQDASVVPTNVSVLRFKNRTSGMSAYFVDETSDFTESGITYANETLTIKKLGTLSDPISNELMNDGMVDMMQEVGIEAAEALAYAEDNAVFNGTGSGASPFTGVLQHSGTVKKTLQGNVDDISYEALNSMLYAVPSQRLVGAKFYLHRTVLERIMNINDGQGRPLFRQGIGGDPNTILGYPYRLVEAMPAAGAIASGASFMVLGNLRNVRIYDRQMISVRVLNQAMIGSVNLAVSDQVAIQHIERIGIIVRRPAAFVCLKRA